MYVLGTAGHVDHGKSTLVQALTGIDPDRLREEKERGLTIDLGFAWLQLPSGREVSIVDVPGHERFIKNMLAGAGGVDLALLVVAADEGPMPQTVEHLAILDLLDVPSGIVVLTKCDLVEDEYADLVEAELEDVLRGSMLQSAPIVRVSAAAGRGLTALLAAIDAALETTPPKRNLGRARLPIDRAFTMQGFGTVVTGTLLDGSLEVGQEVEIQPAGLRARVRGLQRHRTKVARLEPGTRAAVNLSGVAVEDLRRGMAVATPKTLEAVTAVDVRLRATRILAHPLAHDAGVTFLAGTSESQGRLRLLDREALGPGEEGWAQVVLEEPVAVRRGDRCVIRTPNETAAGGPIVAVNSRRRRRHHAPTLDALERLLAGTPAERLLDLLAARPLAATEAAGRLGVEPAEAADAISELSGQGRVRQHGDLLCSSEWLAAQAGRIEAAVLTFLEANPLRSAAPREHVRSALGLPQAPFEAAVVHAAAGGLVEDRGGGLATPGYAVRLSASQREEADRFLAALRSGGYSPPTDAQPEPALVAYLSETGAIVDAGGVIYDTEVFAEMVARVRAHLQEHGNVTLAEVRDLFGTSRKYAQAFLEHLDALHITRRVRDTRVLRAGGEAPP